MVFWVDFEAFIGAGSLRLTKFGSWKPDFGDVAPNFFRLRRPNPTYLPHDVVRVSFPNLHLLAPMSDERNIGVLKPRPAMT